MGEFHEDSLGNRKHLLDILPLDTVEYACAYGSGAVPQENDGTLGEMVDFIIATRDSKQFHKQNLRMNPTHYSLLRFLGYQKIAQVQRNYAARVYCNTRVSYQGYLIKYSVIDTDDLLLDLIEWRWMYLAGRLQKHVVDVISPSPRITLAMEKNRSSALQAALLLLPDKFSLSQFYNELISLSYRGDFRMSFGEDKNKIGRIADGSRAQLNQIYVPLLKADEDVFIQGRTIEQDRCDAVLFKRITGLPFNVLWNLQRRINSINGKQNDIDPKVLSIMVQEEIAASLARRLDGPKPVAAAIEDIVWRSALQQTAKNAFSAAKANNNYTAIPIVSSLKIQHVLMY
uniref:Phosphatidate cytidylyltransferase, mitochondrial n=1 Tax=Wuchereria bancrofti TaxID=6293 RepID=A0A1I8EHE2_WUCBA